MTIWGAAAGSRNGLSGLQEWIRIDNVLRSMNGGYGMEIRRTYENGIPNTLAASAAGADVGHRASALSFGFSGFGMIASGAHDSDINDLMDSKPAGHILYLGYHHEPEATVEGGNGSADDWCQDVAALMQLIKAQNDPEIIGHFALMSFTFKSGSHRNPANYNPGQYMTTGEKNICVAGEDGYALEGTSFPHTIFDPCLNTTRGWGFQRHAIWETGVRDVSNRSAWFNALGDWCVEENIEAMCYFHTNYDPSRPACYIDLETYDHNATETFAALTKDFAGAQVPDIPPDDPDDPPPPPIEPPPPVPEADINTSETIWLFPAGGIGDEEETLTNTGWWVDVREWDNPDQIIVSSYKYQSLAFSKPMNDVGVGEVTLSREDPIAELLVATDEEPELLLRLPSYWSFMKDGAERFRMIYDTKTKDRAKTTEAELVVLGGVGLAEHLAWAVVLPNGWPGNDKARPRKRTDAVWANLWLDLFHESQDRGEIPDWMQPSFSQTHDSLGRAWLTLGDREVEVGTNLLDLLQSTADAEEFDWIVTPQGIIHAAPVLGADLTNDIRFFNAVTNNEVGATEDRKDVRTIAYVEGVAGRVSKATSEPGRRKWGKRAIYLRSEEASSERQRLRVANGTLRQTRQSQRERSVKVPINPVDPITALPTGRTCFVDYGVGDTIGLGPQIDNTTGIPLESRNVRVIEIGVRVEDGQDEVELMLETRNERYEERVRRLLQQRFGAWSSAKTARQGKSPVANLRDTDAEFPNPGDSLVYHDDDELWHNGRPLIPFPFFYFGVLDYTGEEMYLPVDTNRDIVRVTGRLAVPSDFGPVTLVLKRNDIPVHTMNMQAGEKRVRVLVHIPLTEDDDLSLAVTDPGSGAENLQYVAEAGG